MDDLGAQARIAISLVVLGVLLGTIFTILGFVQGTTRQGVAATQNSLNALQESEYTNYDQEQKSGTEVGAALNLFSGRKVGIVIRTTAQMAATPNTGHNYGVLFTGTNTSTYVTPAMTKIAGQSRYILNLGVVSGVYSVNLNFIPTKDTGTIPFVRPSAKFMAELIEDATGSIVGICFTQIQ